jgi:hypothetical protein
VPYHAPTNVAEIDQWLQGKMPDPSNVYDTPDTVNGSASHGGIRKNNAAIQSICGASAIGG